MYGAADKELLHAQSTNLPGTSGPPGAWTAEIQQLIVGVDMPTVLAI